jgi:hypothetical protein
VITFNTPRSWTSHFLLGLSAPSSSVFFLAQPLPLMHPCVSPLVLLTLESPQLSADSLFGYAHSCNSFLSLSFLTPLAWCGRVCKLSHHFSLYNFFFLWPTRALHWHCRLHSASQQCCCFDTLPWLHKKKFFRATSPQFYSPLSLRHLLTPLRLVSLRSRDLSSATLFFVLTLLLPS